MFRKIFGIILVIVAVSSTLSTGGLAVVDDNEAVNAIIEQENNVKGVKIVDQVQHKLQSGIVVDRYKAEDDKGLTYSIALVNGKSVNYEELMLNEVAIQRKSNGKLDPALAEKLKTAKKNETISVNIWVVEPERSQEKYAGKAASGNIAKDENSEVEATKDDIIALMEQASKDRAGVISAAVEPVTKELKKKNIKHIVDANVPVIYTTLTLDQINDISKYSAVDTVYLDGTAVNALNVAYQAINAKVVYSRNIAGFGVKMAEIEVGGGIDSNGNPLNPYLARPIELDRKNTCLSTHAAAVAGIIRSWNPTYFGTSPGAWLRIGGSCNGFISQLTQANDRATTWGARISSNSWQNLNADGNRKFEDRYFDSKMFSPPYLLPIVAAGNTGGRVTSPGLQYNGITVGAFDDKNSVSWIGDTMASFSGYKDGNNGMEKPEVVAPGVNLVSTTNAFPWTAEVGSGTSYATPIVSGEAALLIQRNSGLTYNPEAIKAIIMATAVHNIEGSAVLSEKDGAGGIVADRADNVARGINGNWGEINYTCASPSPVVLANMPLTAGVPTRAVMAFSSNPNYILDAFNPSADLDIRIYNPSGVQVASSQSIDNTFEIVGFTPTVSGTYQLRMNKVSCTSVNWVGWAWYKGT